MDGIPKLTANELRRQRDRERYVSLSVEEKAALVQKNRENRNRKNSATTSGTDVAAIVCDVGPEDHYARFPNSVREVALMDSNYQVAFLRAFDEVADFYRSQLITSETLRGIVVAMALEVDKASNCLSTTAATTLMFLHNRDYQRYALLEKVRNSLLKEPSLHDAIKIVVTYRKQELMQLGEQNNDPAEPEVVIVEDDEVVIEPVPKKKRTSNKGFTIPPRVEVIDIPSTP
uniref:Uncharacterized protein n=1 Tax=Oryza punctata TaxID=4537 RepID=A0A0E0JG65_ORYPU